MATARLSLAATTQFDAGLLRTSLLANSRLQALETDRLAQRRAATDTVGVPEAMLRGDRSTLWNLLAPIAANAAPTDLELRVLDAHRDQLLGVGFGPAGPLSLTGIDPELVSAAPIQDALGGQADGLGERNVFLLADTSQPELYWVGPVWNSGQQAVGAILLGQSVAEIARGIAGASFYDENGVLLSSALQTPPLLSQAVRHQVAAGQAVRVMDTRDGHQYGTLFNQWRLRGR